VAEIIVAEIIVADRSLVRLGSARPVSPPSLTHYVVVRRDLPLGFLAAQVVHAAGELELLELASRLSAAGVSHRLIREPDPPWLGQATAIGLEPVADRAPLRALLRGLLLLGKEVARAA
jgi:hypothetical protein